MNKFFLAVTMALLSTIPLLAQPVTLPEKDAFEPDPDLAKQLDEACLHFVDAGYLSGGVNMIAHKGKIIYQKAYGIQSIEEKQPMQLNSLFRIASMTKPITTVALLLLVEEGKISLDDKAEKYLPRFADVKVLAADGSRQPPKQAVTIRHLLMHTSGTRSRGDAWFKRNGIDVASATTLEDYVNRLLKAPLVFHPGEGFNYAMNNDICARIVEIVTGQNYGDFLSQRVLQPLEMTDTWFIVPDTALNRLCSLYGYEDGKLVLAEGKEAVQSAFPRGNGQLVSTAGDYMNFLHMLANQGVFKGKRFIKAETLELMTGDKLPPNIPLQVGNTVFPNAGFGLSIAVSRRSGEPWEPMPLQFENLFQHLPAGSLIWPGVANTYFWVDPVNEVYGVVLTQSTNPGLVGNFQEFTQAFYRRFFRRAGE